MLPKRKLVYFIIGLFLHDANVFPFLSKNSLVQGMSIMDSIFSVHTLVSIIKSSNREIACVTLNNSNNDSENSKSGSKNFYNQNLYKQ